MAKELSISEKFSVVLGETFFNISQIIGDLNALGKTNLTAGLVITLKDFILSMDKVHLISSFINSSYEYWGEIKKRNEEFMVKDADKIFGEYAQRPEFNAVKSVFTSEV